VEENGCGIIEGTNLVFVSLNMKLVSRDMTAGPRFELRTFPIKAQVLVTRLQHSFTSEADGL